MAWLYVVGDRWTERLRPDKEIFKTLEFSFDTRSLCLRVLSFLNSGLKITVADERSKKNMNFSI